MPNKHLAAALRHFATQFPEATPQQIADLAAILRARGTDLDAMMDEVEARVSPEEWAALEDFYLFCAPHCGLHLEFFRHADGTADYRYRPATEDEAAAQRRHPYER